MLNKLHTWLPAVILMFSTIVLGFNVGQSDFAEIFICYSVFFAVYIYLIKNVVDKKSILFFIGLSIFLRTILVFSFPNLSNDVYRFIWDGRLLIQGFNPFDHLPEHYLITDNPVIGIDENLFKAFGEKNFYTVYPPIAQAQFSSACWLFPQDEYWSAVVMKAWLLLFEIGSIFLIFRILNFLHLPQKNVLLYALNPLVIFEIMGNLHFEGAMIFFFLLAFWLMLKKKLQIAALTFAFSICSKLLTILFLPFLIYQLGLKKSIHYFLIVSIVTILLFVPIINEQFIFNFAESLNLYFQKLEFNASFYYLFRWIGYQVTGYNQIQYLGPILGLLAGLVILWFAFIVYRKEFLDFISRETIISANSSFNWIQFPKYCLFAICVYLFAATTLHPWYVALPIVLCVFTNYRFPIVWSYLIFWTYINYSYEPYQENLWIVALEYLVIFGWLIWELRRNKEKILSLRTG